MMLIMGNANKNLFIIISLSVALILMGVLLPIALQDLTAYDGAYNVTINGTSNAGTNSTVATLVNTIIPIMAVIGIILFMVGIMQYKRNNGGGSL